MTYTRASIGIMAFALMQFSAEAATISFFGLSQDGSGAFAVTTPYTQNGFTFTNSSTWEIWERDSPNHPTGGDASTSLVPYFAGDQIGIAASDTFAFDLVSIDLASWGADQPGASFGVTFAGTRFGGGTVYQTFTVPNYATPQLSTFTFTGFGDVTSVSAVQGDYSAGTAFQFDNVVVDAAQPEAPEPGSAALIAVGLLLVLPGLRKRR